MYVYVYVGVLRPKAGCHGDGGGSVTCVAARHQNSAVLTVCAWVSSVQTLFLRQWYSAEVSVLWVVHRALTVVTAVSFGICVVWSAFVGGYLQPSFCALLACRRQPAVILLPQQL
jgi:hypothetical protein